MADSSSRNPEGTTWWRQVVDTVAAVFFGRIPRVEEEDAGFSRLGTSLIPAPPSEEAPTAHRTGSAEGKGRPHRKSKRRKKKNKRKRTAPPNPASEAAATGAPAPDSHSQPSPDAAAKTQEVVVHTELGMESSHHLYTGLSEDIVDGGIFVATFDPKPVGTKVLVRFKLPGGDPIVARGVVQFVQEDNPLTHADTRTGMGVRFTDLMDSDKRAIEAFLRARKPMFYDA